MEVLRAREYEMYIFVIIVVYEDNRKDGYYIEDTVESLSLEVKTG